MTARQQSVYSTNSKKFFIKRGRIKDESTILNGSIFNTTQTYNMDYSITNSELQKYQTITTAVDNTITLHTNPEEIVELTSKSYRKDKNSILPKIYLTSDSKCIEESKQIQSQLLSSLQKRQKILSQHPSDPLYLKLDKTSQKRTSEKFKKYKKGWMDQSIRRKQKSVIQRSLQKAADNIQFINADANRRKNTTQLADMLRNNIDEKTFIFPGKLRPEIAGLKGKGGKVIPLFSEVYVIEEVYKHNCQGH